MVHTQFSAAFAVLVGYLSALGIALGGIGGLVAFFRATGMSVSYQFFRGVVFYLLFLLVYWSAMGCSGYITRRLGTMGDTLILLALLILTGGTYYLNVSPHLASKSLLYIQIILALGFPVFFLGALCVPANMRTKYLFSRQESSTGGKS